MLDELKNSVCAANLELVKRGVVIYTWGNVSGIDRDKGLVVIKPSGVSYDGMCPDDMVIVDLESGKVVEGNRRPSSDTQTHLQLYRSFPAIGGITHTHSVNAVAFAQAGIDIPAPPGTKFIAVHDGIITFREFLGAGGYTITLSFDNYKVSYCHCDPNFIVEVGQEIKQGQVIGFVGPKNVYGVVGNRYFAVPSLLRWQSTGGITPIVKLALSNSRFCFEILVISSIDTTCC